MTTDAHRKTIRPARRWLGVAMGTLAVAFGVRTTSTAATEVADPSATEAPASWQHFAKRLQVAFQERLSSDNENAQRFRDAVAKLDRDAGALVVRVWVLPDGKVERVELEGHSNDDALHELYGAVIGDSVGAAPPDMPQPLRMRM